LNEVVGARLDDLGQIGPGAFGQSEDDGHPREPLVERTEASEAAPVHEGRPGDEDIPRSAGQPGPRRRGIGASLDDRARIKDLVADPGRQISVPVENEDARREPSRSWARRAAGGAAR
jgi:hypothetical protein